MCASGSEPAIRIEGLRKTYGHSVALDGVDLSVGRGESWALLGPNGSGKTTLLRIIATLAVPSGGIAHVFDMPVTIRAQEVRREIGYVPQIATADLELTCAENLHFIGRLFSMRREVQRARIDALLAFFGLEESRNQLVGKLSGGMRRRIELARALVHEPRILLLDEPTAGLDSQARESLWDLLHRLRRDQGLTLLMATHRIDDAEAGCDRVAILRRGKIAQSTRIDGSAPLAEIYSSGSQES